jgi:hypothetical protein
MGDHIVARGTASGKPLMGGEHGTGKGFNRRNEKEEGALGNEFMLSDISVFCQYVVNNFVQFNELYPAVGVTPFIPADNLLSRSARRPPRWAKPWSLRYDLRLWPPGPNFASGKPPKSPALAVAFPTGQAWTSPAISIAATRKKGIVHKDHQKQTFVPAQLSTPPAAF